jgi:hypothetical protein
MFLLIIISIVGFVLSALLHFFMLFHVYNPPRGLTIFVNISAAFVVYMAIFISKRVCKKANIKDSKKAIYNLCPKWISALTGFLIMYTLAGFLLLIFKKYFGNSISTNSAAGENFRNFSGHWMALYALAFSIVYSCKKYVDTLKGDK